MKAFLKVIIKLTACSQSQSHLELARVAEIWSWPRCNKFDFRVKLIFQSVSQNYLFPWTSLTIPDHPWQSPTIPGISWPGKLSCWVALWALDFDLDLDLDNHQKNKNKTSFTWLVLRSVDKKIFVRNFEKMNNFRCGPNNFINILFGRQWIRCLSFKFFWRL